MDKVSETQGNQDGSEEMSIHLEVMSPKLLNPLRDPSGNPQINLSIHIFKLMTKLVCIRRPRQNPLPSRLATGPYAPTL